jgi:hypothetical protein
MSALSGKSIARGAIGLAFLVAASACAGTDDDPPYPVPGDPGIYALTDDCELRRLDGHPEWEAETWPERADLPGNVQFVINEPALAGRSAGSAVELWRAAWVRSEIDAQGQPTRVQGSEWAVAPLEPFDVPFRYESPPGQTDIVHVVPTVPLAPLEPFDVPFRYESPPGQTDIVHVVPTVPLAPGLYTVRIVDPGARQARLGVGWNGVDQRQYSAANCVDRYDDNVYRACTAPVPSLVGAAPKPGDPSAAGVTAIENGGLPSVSPPQPAAPVVLAPAPTAADPLAVATSPIGLQITLADPVRRDAGLVIRGAITNTSSQVLAIPSMQGSLENAAGDAMQSWVFPPPVQTLAPGERANFSTEVRPIPAGTARASVAFIAR